jgi:hypothetical protein|tara:strand:+ start:81 stop:281 length:201 start_codon:yes stop_codon:yes gene_type:complete
MKYINKIKVNIKIWQINRVKKALALAEEKASKLAIHKWELEEALRNEQVELIEKSFFPHTSNYVFK